MRIHLSALSILASILVFPALSHSAATTGDTSTQPVKPSVQVIAPYEVPQIIQPTLPTVLPTSSKGETTAPTTSNNLAIPGLDSSFGNDGLAQFNAWTSHSIEAKAAAYQLGGKSAPLNRIIIVGSAKRVSQDDSHKDFFILAVKASGSNAGQLDTSFGPRDSAGTVWVDFFGLEDVAQAVAILPNGNIMVSGYAMAPGSFKQLAVIVLSPAGELLESWGELQLHQVK